MIVETLAHYIGVKPAQIQRLLSLAQSQVYADDEYRTWLGTLDAALLYETLTDARAAYESQLDVFSSLLRDRYGMGETRMSSFTLGNWLIGFLQYPDTIARLSQMHSRIPQQAFLDMLPDMIKMLDSMNSGRADWQKALALMALPLAAPRD
jgi:hypothetical protein